MKGPHREKERARSWALVIFVAVGVGAGLLIDDFLPDRDRGSTEYRSVAFLVEALERDGLECGDALTVQVSRQSADQPFESGSCARFAGGDQADFYTFPDSESGQQWIQEIEDTRTGGISGVRGSSWFVSVRLESTARDVQAAIGGEVIGY